MSQRIEAHFIAAGKYHDIDYARLEVLKLLAENPRIRTTVAMDYGDIDRIRACDFLITYTCDVLPTPDEVAALRAYVEGGGRWFALHGTNSILRFLESGLVSAPELAPDFMALLGTQFKAHPPIDKFKVTVTDRTHALTRGIDDFEIVDELYLSKTTADIHTLMHTQFKGEATGFEEADWDEKQVPIFYLREVGKGAILYITLGHCRGHYDLPGMVDFYPHKELCAWNYDVYYELLRRGLAWSTRQL